MLIAALLLLRSEWEKVQLKMDHYEIRTDRLPQEVKKVRLVFVTDLHDYLPARHTPGVILDAVEREKPDAVIIGGDLITVSKREQRPVPEVRSALALVKQLSGKYPVFYGEGNHEARLRERNPVFFEGFAEELASCGVKYLKDVSEDIPRTGVKVSSIALSDSFYDHFPGIGKKYPMPEHYIENAIGTADKNSFNIFLIHNPLYLEEAEKAGADLVLSGHFHGGTVRLPDGSGLMTPQLQFFQKECSGEFECGSARMIVGRGLGTHSIKIRINDLPQLAVIDITNERESQLQN